MKATIDIPDDLYRRVKAKTALKGRSVRDVTIELFQKWVDEEQEEPSQTSTNWLDDLLKHAIPANTPGPTAREILEQDRNRLEPGHDHGGCQRLDVRF
ncbi:MAG: hypothetical protein HC901_00015 [Bdellovibrionaceae bacterium]|nr:hypothetical protein [Pseudobdellovibrionaceae bacterium]